MREALKFPSGKDAGKSLKLAPFQDNIIYEIYGEDEQKSEIILTFPRKNGKSFLTAALVMLHLCGPEAELGGQIFSVANDRTQAKIIFDMIETFIRSNPALKKILKVIPSKHEIRYEAKNVIFRSLSSEASTAHGLSPSVVIIDECGQIKTERSKLIEALVTGSAARENPRFFYISTQAESDQVFFSQLIDDFERNPKPHRLLKIWRYEGSEPFTAEALAAANPAWSVFQNQKLMLQMADDAKNSPSRQPAYLNLYLNQRVSGDVEFVNKSQWEGTSKPHKGYAGHDVVCAIDLSKSGDMTGLVVGWIDEEGDMCIEPYSYLPGENIKERSQRENVKFDEWAEQGLLTLAGDKTIDYKHLLLQLKAIHETENTNITSIQIDPYRLRFLLLDIQELENEGHNFDFFHEKMQEFRQGQVSMNPGVYELEKRFINGKMKHGNHPILRHCFQNVGIKIQANASDRMFVKKTKNRRIDLAVCACMIAATLSDPDSKSSELEFW